MESFRVKITRSASEDIRKIVEHIAYRLNNPEAALSISEMIISSAESLSIFPKRHRVRREDSYGRSIRFCLAGNYVIAYCVDDNSRTVEILRVFHSRRDMNNLF